MYYLSDPINISRFRAQPRPELLATREYILEHLGDPMIRLLHVRRAAPTGRSRK